MENASIGIDIGGTSVKAGLVSEHGEIIHRIQQQTLDERNPGFPAFVERLLQIIHQLEGKAGNRKITGIGIGAPNGNHYSGSIEFAPNLVWKGILPIKQLLEDRSAYRVVLTNDANAAAMGERMYGGARDLDHFVLLTLGTGLGSGLFVNGQLLYGHDGFAGELGHSIVYPNGRDCSCGRKGCLEAYVSIRGILSSYSDLSAKDTSALTPLILYQRAREGDTAALQAFEKTGRILGLKLADIACYTSPEAIFLAGGLSRAGDMLLDSARKSMNENLHNIYRGKIRLLLSSLPENDAAILGAAALIS